MKKNYDFCVILNRTDIKRIGRDGIEDPEAESKKIKERYTGLLTKKVEVYYIVNTER